MAQSVSLSAASPGSDHDLSRWKGPVTTTVFWIGPGSAQTENRRTMSWDMSWKSGDDNKAAVPPDGWNSSVTNPFYIALPFNDCTHPELAKRWLPSSWKNASLPSGVSVCKHRWIEMKNAANRVCYAQWEDVGPLITDDAAYVFGSRQPRAFQGRALDVSPAVAKYLGIDSAAKISWRFVPASEVPPGPWIQLRRNIRAGPSIAK